MARGFVVNSHHTTALTAFLVLLLTAIVFLIFIGLTEVAFQGIGITRFQFALILIGTLIGSYLDLPLGRVKSGVNIFYTDTVRAFWVTYRVPALARRASTTVAVNLGGAVIPLIVSVYMLFLHPLLIGYCALGTAITSVLVHLVARKERGVGIVTPPFIPPLIAAGAAFILAPSSPSVVAYVSGTIGTLIGADITNLRGIAKLGSPIVSIGGAGKFDGIFLTGIAAVLLTLLIRV